MHSGKITMFTERRVKANIKLGSAALSNMDSKKPAVNASASRLLNLPSEVLMEIFDHFNLTRLPTLRDILNIRLTCGHLRDVSTQFLRGKLSVIIGRKNFEDSLERMRSCPAPTDEFAACFSKLSFGVRAIYPKRTGTTVAAVVVDKQRVVLAFMLAAARLAKRVGRYITTLEITTADSQAGNEEISGFLGAVAVVLGRDNMPNLKCLAVYCRPSVHLNKFVECCFDAGLEVLARRVEVVGPVTLTNASFKDRVVGKLGRGLKRNPVDVPGYIKSWNDWPTKASIPLLSRIETLKVYSDPSDNASSKSLTAFSSFLQAFPNVKELTYDGLDTETFFERNTFHAPSLRSFKMAHRCFQPALLTGGMLRNWSGHLTRLEITDCFVYMSPDEPRLDNGAVAGIFAWHAQSYHLYRGHFQRSGHITDHDSAAWTPQTSIGAFLDELLPTLANLEHLRIDGLAYPVWHLQWEMDHHLHVGRAASRCNYPREAARVVIPGSPYRRPILTPFNNGDVEALRRLMDGYMRRRAGRGLGGDPWLDFLYENEMEVCRVVSVGEMYGYAEPVLPFAPSESYSGGGTVEDEEEVDPYAGASDY